MRSASGRGFILQIPNHPLTVNIVKTKKNFLILNAASALLITSFASGGNTWDGEGADGNWSNSLNWDSDTPPNYASLLTFAGSTGLTSVNDTATAIAGISFSSGAGAFTINGNSVNLGGNITNNSTSLQTVNLPLVLTANRNIATTSGSVTLGGPISGAFSLIKTQGNTLNMNTAGSSFNLFQINTGTARLMVNDALPTTAGVTFSTGTTAILNLNGKTQTLGGAITVGGTATASTVTVSDTAGGGVLKLGGGVVQNATASSTVTISAALDLNGSTRVFTLNNPSGIITVSGVIGNSSGTAGLTRAGSGAGSELILSGANTYNGNTTVSTGLLTLGNSLALQNSILDTAASIASSGATTGLKTTVTTLTFGGLSGNKSLASLFDTANGYGGVTALTLNPASGQTANYSGALSDGATGMTLTKSGAGTQTLSGGAGNTLSGAINVNEGTLISTKGTDDVSSLKNMPGAITVAAGATLSFDQAFATVPDNNLANALTISGAGTGGLGALNLWRNATASGTITLAADATISHDFNTATITGPITGTNRNLTLATLTTGTPQPGMTVSGPISLGTGGITVQGVANSGGFSIKLSGSNSYTGETRVVSGTLMLSGAARIDDTAAVRIEAGGVMNLDFLGEDTVGALYLPGDPNPKPNGTYGSLASTATYKSADFAGNGILKVQPASNNYDGWAVNNGIPGEDFDGDFNQDGISNGVAYALGLSPTVFTQPAGDFSGTTISFTKGAEAIANGDVSWIIQASETLEAGSWTDQTVHAPGDTEATITYNLVPLFGNPKEFARLKVIRIP